MCGIFCLDKAIISESLKFDKFAAKQLATNKTNNGSTTTTYAQ